MPNTQLLFIKLISRFISNQWGPYYFEIGFKRGQWSDRSLLTPYAYEFSHIRIEYRETAGIWPPLFFLLYFIFEN